MINYSNTTIDTDQPSVHSYLLGAAITAVCVPGLIANILVAYVEVKKGLLTTTNSSMYKLSFNLLIADTIHLAILAFYLGPSSMLQNWLLPDNWTREIPGRLLMVVWYQMLIDLILLGANRYFAICKPYSYPTAFSKRNTNVMIALSWIFAVLICVIGEQLLPCCSLYLYYKIFSYGFIEQGGFNYNDIYVIILANTFVTLFIIVAYALVIYNIRIMNARVADSISTESQHRRHIKEVRYAFQLIMISSVFVAVWILFNIFANVIPTREATSGYLSIVILLEVINASANSFVCILFNREIQNSLKHLFFCCCDAPISITGATSSVTHYHNHANHVKADKITTKAVKFAPQMEQS